MNPVRSIRLSFGVWLWVLCALTASGPLDAATPVPAISDARALPIQIRAPKVRIGLTTPSDQIRLGGTGTFRVFDVASGAEIWTDRGEGPLLIVPVGEPAAGGYSHRIQVGAYRSESAAQRVADKVAREHRVQAEAVWQASRLVWRVHVGHAESSGQLEELLEDIRQSGYSDAWIVRQEEPRLVDAKLRALDERWNARDAPSDRVVVVPTGDTRVTVQDREYRGLIELRLTQAGGVRAINELNMEQYLRGVVPVELGPAAFPELEALKAQAVAARTYVVANLGQYRDEGYDICDSPRCQAYGGRSAEHRLSDRAVRETASQILVHEGAPINAMYTSTCGGHTEDLKVVFPDMNGPYLQGVECRPDSRELERRTIRVAGRAAAEDSQGARGDDVLTLAALVAHNVVPPDALSSSARQAPLETGELLSSASRLAELAGKPSPSRAPDSAARRSLWPWWAEVLSVGGEGHGLVPDSAQDLVLSAVDADGFAEADRGAVAALISLNLVRPRADGRLDPAGVPTRGEWLNDLAQAARTYRAAELRSATVISGSSRRLLLREGRTEKRWRLAEDGGPFLLSESPAGWTQATRVDLHPGDKVLFAGDGAQIVLLAVNERKSRTDDRRSSRFRWTVTKDRSELEKTLSRVAPVGRLQDLEISQRGVSGRVAELTARGTRGNATVGGFRLRRALGLPEILFEMDIQREADGLVRRVTFHGRGWGHGVGMCQFGAYGMAVRGKSYRDILTHYYSDVRIASYRPR